MTDDSAGRARGAVAISHTPVPERPTPVSIPGPNPGPIPRDRGSSPEVAKFDLGGPAPPFDAGELPWAYGEDRITALVRSPDSLYVYWEITDEGIASARARLGPAGAHAGFALRVYDTTARVFDGTNANDYFDVRIDRNEREYFLTLSRPTASFHVEVGMISGEGFFQPIARTGRADFPRKAPSPNQSLEWMTVTGDQPPPAARPYHSRYTGPPPGTWSPSPAVHGEAAGAAHGDAPSGGEAPRETRTWTWAHPAHVDVRWEGPWVFDAWKAEWRLHWLGGKSDVSIGPLEGAEWSVGPFPVHILDPDRIDIRWVGDGPVRLEEHRSGLEVFGPWRVTIQGTAFEGERRILSTWRVHWVRVSPPQVERWWSAFERRRTEGWQRKTVVGGASEAHVVVEAGASEAWRVGASERWAIGGSEWFAMGGSEVAWLGASQAALGGASAALFGGASGWGAAGAGSSPGMWSFGGASDRAASEMVGGSERWSEAALRGTGGQ